VPVRYRSSQGYSLTPIWVLLAVNFLFFIASLAREGLVLDLFGLMPFTFLNEPWTIVTNMFVHGGWTHIIFNMLALFFLGSYLLRLIGETKFLIVYFVGGILGNVFFIWLGNPFAIAVGASGAIFALGGALAAMRPRMKVIIFPIFIPLDLWIAIIILMGISFIPYRVAWQAHLGGLVFGLIAGYYFRRRERRIFWR
jgi:membrane associated rhomboid family serine protease